MLENGRWDLTPLYESLDDPRIDEDFGRLSKLVEGSRCFFENKLASCKMSCPEKR